MERTTTQVHHNVQQVKITQKSHIERIHLYDSPYLYYRQTPQSHHHTITSIEIKHSSAGWVCVRITPPLSPCVSFVIHRNAGWCHYSLEKDGGGGYAPRACIWRSNNTLLARSLSIHKYTLKSSNRNTHFPAAAGKISLCQQHRRRWNWATLLCSGATFVEE